MILGLDSVKAGPRLLGWVLCRRLPDGLVKARIVETEAYCQDDPASHSFRGPTKRTAPMFKSGGHIYIYFTYGSHYCLNVVTGPAGRGEAVLLRAAEPLEGIDIMIKNRYGPKGSAGRQGKAVRGLCNGPGKLTQAFGITNTSLSGTKLLNMLSNFEKANKLAPYKIPSGAVSNQIVEHRDFYAGSSIFLEPPPAGVKRTDIASGPRIGIRRATEEPQRFFLKNSPYLSR